MGSEVKDISAIIAGLVQAWAIIFGANGALLIRTPDGLAPLGGNLVEVEWEPNEKLAGYLNRAAEKTFKEFAGNLGLSLSRIDPRYTMKPYFSKKGTILVGCAIPIVYLDSEIVAPEEAGLEIVSLYDLNNEKINDQLVLGEDMRRLIHTIAHFALIA